MAYLKDGLWMSYPCAFCFGPCWGVILSCLRIAFGCTRGTCQRASDWIAALNLLQRVDEDGADEGLRFRV